MSVRCYYLLTRTPSPDILIRISQNILIIVVVCVPFCCDNTVLLGVMLSVVEMAVPAVREMLSTEALQTN